MKTVIYTAPQAVRNETSKITEMLELGADYLFLKRDGADTHYWMSFLEEIPQQFYSRIFTTDYRVLHEMGLGGFHFRGEVLQRMDPKDLRENLSMLRNRDILTSRTVRNVNELRENDAWFDIILAAPVFESISKPSHVAAWDFEALKVFLSDKKRRGTVVALGGIAPDKLDMLHLLGMDGVGLLGILWQQPDEAVNIFQNILVQCQ